MGLILVVVIKWIEWYESKTKNNKNISYTESEKILEVNKEKKKMYKTFNKL